MKLWRGFIVAIIIAFACSWAFGGGGELNGIQILVSRITAARAGYLDALNLGGSYKAASDQYYTSARATKVDNLDAAVTTRAAAATALSSATWTNTRAGYLDNLSAGAMATAASVAAIPTTPINSIQRGSLAMAAGDGGTKTATITAVTTAKSVLLFSYHATGSPSTHTYPISGTITNTTTLTFTCGVSDDYTIEWQVVEFK